MPDPLMTTSLSSDQTSRSPVASHGFAWYVLLALTLAFVIRFFIAAPYVVSGSSMEPTFDNWDYLITDRISYRTGEPQRGDVIVFCLPGNGECSLIERIKVKQWVAPRTLIKRVIGLPGETVTVSGTKIHIVSAANPEGITLEEPYIALENYGGPASTEITLGAEEYFVMGDNRRVSSDSRTWGILPKKDIIGHVLIRLFPVSQLGVLPGDATYSNDFSSAIAE